MNHTTDHNSVYEKSVNSEGEWKGREKKFVGNIREAELRLHIVNRALPETLMLTPSEKQHPRVGTPAAAQPPAPAVFMPGPLQNLSPLSSSPTKRA